MMVDGNRSMLTPALGQLLTSGGLLLSAAPLPRGSGHFPSYTCTTFLPCASFAIVTVCVCSPRRTEQSPPPAVAWFFPSHSLRSLLHGGMGSPCRVWSLAPRSMESIEATIGSWLTIKSCSTKGRATSSALKKFIL